MDEQEEGNGRASIEEAIDVFQVNVQLPTGETLTLETKGSSSVRDLKIIVEVNSGVPSDLFTLVHKRADENNVTKLSDETKMADINTFIDLEATSGSVTFELSIILWWERFVHRCMQLDNRQILKRICIKMNQISSEDRAFVAAFIAAQKGDGQLFQTLLGGDVKVDVQRTHPFHKKWAQCHLENRKKSVSQKVRGESFNLKRKYRRVNTSKISTKGHIFP